MIKIVSVMGGLLAGVTVLSAPAMAEPVKLSATLSGANETEGGDPDGSGAFSAELDPETGDVCYTLAAEGIGAPTAAHIHTGNAGEDGPPVVTLEMTGADSDMCIAVPLETVSAILATPEGHYVNVHNAEYPKGAVRGQLGK